MRVLLSGGGTGGHVYPALAVIEVLRPRSEASEQGTSPIPTGFGPGTSDVELLWVGSRAGIEADLVRRAGIPFTGIDAAGVRGMDTRQQVRNLGQLARGLRQAWQIIGRFRPDVMLVTGGYVSVPVTLAGRARGIPGLIILPDVIPGLAIRFLARMVDRVAVSFGASLAYLPAEKTVMTGYPVRPALYRVDRSTARRRLGLDPELKTVLIFGGSSGARCINRATAEALPELLALAEVIHLSGQLDRDELAAHRQALPVTLRTRYRLFPYLHNEMMDALAAADLVVSRAGAATLGEFPAVGLPAILVPYPHAGAHQAENAAILAQAGAARVVLDAELTGTTLLAAVRALLTDPLTLATMREKMRQLSRPEAAARIAELLVELGRG